MVGEEGHSITATVQRQFNGTVRKQLCEVEAKNETGGFF